MKATKKFSRLFAVFGITFAFAGSADAQLDQELAELSTRNDSGPYVAATGLLGQAKLVGNSNPGMALLAGVDLGYVMARGSWSRLEGGVELLTGNFQYADKASQPSTQVDADVNYLALAKIGYGYSLGHQLMAIWKLGFGQAGVQYSGKSGDQRIRSNATASGLAWQLSGEIAYASAKRLAWTGGLRFSQVQYTVNEVTVNGKSIVDERNQVVNLIGIQLGVRYSL